MYTENIIRDIRDIIYDAKQASAQAYEYRRDADNTFGYVEEGSEGSLDSYNTVSEGLVDASYALDRCSDKFKDIEAMLQNLIYAIEMEALSAKVQAK